jgi:peptide/nickel transport system permease protein
MPGIARRLAQLLGKLVLVALLVTMMTGLLIHLSPGNPARTILGNRASPAQVAELSQQMHLNAPLWDQLWLTVRGAATGNLGMSLSEPGRSVLSIILSALPVTLTLIAIAVAVSAVIGIALGLWGALTSHRLIDEGVSGSAITLLALPPFVLALLLLEFVAVDWKVAPAGGWGLGWPDHLVYAWLPSLALCGLLMPQVLRTARQTAGEIRAHDFIEAAHSRGLSAVRVTLRHVLPNAALPVITVLGLNAAGLIAGAVVVEAVFGLPGLGQVLQNAVGARDYPLLQGVALVTALLVVIINAVTDLSYTLIDPRTRTAP